MTFYFHWVDVGTTDAEWITASTWNAAYAVNDEDVLSVKIVHEEGQIPSMTVQVRNPQIGLLNASRPYWAWLSWNGNGYLQPLFFGRLVGVPSDLLSEAVTLQFTARSKTFVLDKQIAAERLKVRPYYDPVFIDPLKRDDPDTILEGYSALWHIDRVSLDIKPSDILIGEDGNAIFLAEEVPYESVQVTLNQVPLTTVYVAAEVTWNQEFTGYIDSGTDIVKTYSGDGILSDWPKPTASLGGGWSVVSSFIKDLNKIDKVLTVSYSTSWDNKEKRHSYGDTMSVTMSRSYPNFSYNTDYVYRRITYQQVIGILDPHTVDLDGDPSPTNIPESLSYTETYVPAYKIKYGMGLRYDASRARSERIEFILSADTQELLTEATVDQETDTITLNGTDVGTPIIKFKNWTSVAGKYVSLGTFIFPDNPSVAGQKSIQICVDAGIAGTTIPTFSNVAGTTTTDGGVIWSSLGSANGIYNISTDWTRDTEIPLGEIILPRVPFSILYKDFVAPGRMQDPEVGVSVALHQIVEVPNYGFYECTLSGTTDKKNPNWKTDGSITKDGTVEWSFIGATLPDGVHYYICTHSGKTGEYLPAFGEGDTKINDGTVVWTKLPASEVPVGGAPGKTPRNDYFPTDRGQRSIEYLLCLARSRLRMRARAVEVAFECSFERVSKLSCRMNATIYDRRIPGGVATGKIVGYALEANGDEGMLIGKVRIGCSVGKGSSLDIALGDPVYVEEGYAEPGYQIYTGSTAQAGDDIGYTRPESNATDTFQYPLTADQVFLNGGIQVRGDISKQEKAIAKALDSAWVATNLAPTNIDSVQKSILAQQLAIQAAANSVQINLQQNPIWLELELKPVTGIQYDNFYSLKTSKLPIPKTIDLEAASNSATPPTYGTNTVFAGAAFLGNGKMKVDAKQPFKNANAKFGASGSLAVYAGVIRKGSARFSASASAPTLKGYVTASAKAAFVGTARVPFVNSSAKRRMLASVAGTGKMAASATIRIGRAAGFGGSGTMDASATIRIDHAARFAGEGILSATPFSGAASLSGSGSVAVTTTYYGSSGALFNGEGTYVDDSIPTGSALFSGESTLPTSATALLSSVSAMAASAVMETAANTESVASAAMAGSGGLTAVPDPDGYRYWRIYITANLGLDGYTTFTGLDLFTSIGGSNVATGGTALESGHFAGATASRLYDGNITTEWSSPTASVPCWVGYDFGAGVTKNIVSLKLYYATSPYHQRAPKNFDVQYSSDGSNWTTYWSVTNATSSSGGNNTYSKP